MNDGTLETIDGRNVLCFRRRLNHSAERVWRALADTDEQEHWFPAGEPLRVTVSEPSRLLEGTWFGDTLRFALTPEGDGCVLEFTHTFADRAIAARTAAGWDRCLARLQALLAGSPMGEAQSLQEWPAVHEAYAAAFGVDPRLGREAFAAHPLT